jgi:carboxypeptidase PM20D1
VLDEGGAVAAQAFPGVEPPLAVIGVTEKGTTSLELASTGRGGHASHAARMGPTARIARAVLRLEGAPVPDAHPRADPRAAAPHRPARAARRCDPLLARADRLGPLLARLLVAAGPEAAAMTRTTAAVTTLSGSPR